MKFFNIALLALTLTISCRASFKNFEESSNFSSDGGASKGEDLEAGEPGGKGDTTGVSIIVETEFGVGVEKKCPEGGKKIVTGDDKNLDGDIDDEGEITKIEYICYDDTDDDSTKVDRCCCCCYKKDTKTSYSKDKSSECCCKPSENTKDVYTKSSKDNSCCCKDSSKDGAKTYHSWGQDSQSEKSNTCCCCTANSSSKTYTKSNSEKNCCCCEKSADTSKPSKVNLVGSTYHSDSKSSACQCNKCCDKESSTSYHSNSKDKEEAKNCCCCCCCPKPETKK